LAGLDFHNRAARKYPVLPAGFGANLLVLRIRHKILIEEYFRKKTGIAMIADPGS